MSDSPNVKQKKSGLFRSFSRRFSGRLPTSSNSVRSGSAMSSNSSQSPSQPIPSHFILGGTPEGTPGSSPLHEGNSNFESQSMGTTPVRGFGASRLLPGSPGEAEETPIRPRSRRLAETTAATVTNGSAVEGTHGAADAFTGGVSMGKDSAPTNIESVSAVPLPALNAGLPPNLSAAHPINGTGYTGDTGDTPETTGGRVALKRSQSAIDLSDSDSDEPQNSSPDITPTVTSLKVERHTHAHSAMLIEAVNDTPTFHASSEFLHIQIMQLGEWLSSFRQKSLRVDHELHKVKDSVNAVISHFMPSVTHKSLLAQDYTTLLFGRYTEAENLFWTDIFAGVKRSAQSVDLMVRKLQNGVFKTYHESRREYLEAYERLQSARNALFLLPPVALPVAARDANMHAWRCFRQMVRASSKLVLAIAELESECSLQLLETLSNQYVGADSGFLNYDQAKLNISTELYRLKTFAANLRASLPQLHTEMRRLRNEALRSVKRSGPPSNVESYESGFEFTELVSGEAAHKVGWVNVLVGDGQWKIYWAFIQNGLFGLLGLSENGTMVLESNRLVIANSDFTKVDQKDRDNVFRLTSGEGGRVASEESSRSVTMQALHRLDFALWKKAFDATKALSIRKHWNPRELRAWRSEYQIPILGEEVAPENHEIIDHIAAITRDARNAHWLQYSSTLTSEGSAGFGSNVPAVKPMPTAALRQAVIANGLLKPHGIPNAITSNFWGSVGHFAESELLHFSVPSYDSWNAEYPPSYPRGLVVQDMGMRAFAMQLNAEERPEIDDFVVLFFRATTYMFGCEVPARVYATGKKLLFYACWNGLVALQSVPVEKVLEIDSRHGSECSQLIITLHAHDADDAQGAESGSTAAEKMANERRIVRFNLYIDSSALAQRRLSLVLQNRRSRKPLSCEELIEPLGIINLEYAEALKAKEIKLENEIGCRPRAKFEQGPKSFGEWLFHDNVGQRNSLGKEDAYEFGKGMQLKVAQDTFPIPSDVLFTVIFGPRSPVFRENKDEATILIENTVEPWIRNGRRMERRIKQTFRINPNKKRDSRYNYQRLEHREHELFVVTERRCAWELPGGEQFHSIFKYVVYATPTGSHLQIWARVIWRTENVSTGTQDSVNQFVKVIAQTLALRVRDAAATVTTIKDAESRFGEVKATKVVSARSATENRYVEDELDRKVTRVSTHFLHGILLRNPLIFTCDRIAFGLRFGMSYVSRYTSPFFLILLGVAAISLISNCYLYAKSSNHYWSAKLSLDATNSFAERMQLLPPTAPVFRKAIYVQDIDELLRGQNTTNSLPSVRSPNATVHKQGCARRFEDVAEIANLVSDFGLSLYDLEPRIRETVERIATLRLDYASKRNDMMTLIRMLNQNEVNELRGEYERWMISESAACTRIRPMLHSVNESVYENISLYCLSCLDETKSLM